MILFSVLGTSIHERRREVYTGQNVQVDDVVLRNKCDSKVPWEKHINDFETFWKLEDFHEPKIQLHGIIKNYTPATRRTSAGQEEMHVGIPSPPLTRSSTTALVNSSIPDYTIS